jgi:uncharacterized protein
VRFEWDDRKARANLAKHGVSFELAERVFADPLHLSRQDRRVNGEERWQTLGMVSTDLLPLVAHTHEEREGDEVVRIVSACRATAQERRRYEEEG